MKSLPDVGRAKGHPTGQRWQSSRTSDSRETSTSLGMKAEGEGGTAQVQREMEPSFSRPVGALGNRQQGSPAGAGYRAGQRQLKSSLGLANGKYSAHTIYFSF